MYKKLIKNYKIHVWDVAIDDFVRNGNRYIAAKFMNNDNLTTIFDYNTMNVVESNMDPEQIAYVTKKVMHNMEFINT